MNVPCPHCSGSRLQIVLDGASKSLHCRDCGGRFNVPARSTDALYNIGYYFRNYTPRRELQLHQFRNYVTLLQEYGARGPVLDYGCGSGVLLEVLTEAGFEDSCGADVSVDALAVVKQKLGNRVTTIPLQRESFPDTKFGTICLMDSLSHIPDVEQVANRLVQENLAAGGTLLIRTPNITDSYFRLARLLKPIIGLRAYTKLTFADFRYVLFNDKNIRRFVKRLGCEILHEREEDEMLVYPPSRGIVSAGRTVVLKILQKRIPSMVILSRKQ